MDVLESRAPMSVGFHRGGWETRWRDGSGRRRSKRFKDEQSARAFDAELRKSEPADRLSTRRRRRAAAAEGDPNKPRTKAEYGTRNGVYSYETSQGRRWRFVAARSDGRPTSKRGFTSASAARKARRQFLEAIERGEIRHSDETFGSWWKTWLDRRKHYLEEGTWKGYEIHGRKRLLPALADVPLELLDESHIQELADVLAECVEAGELTVKTANNALGTLVVCLNAAHKARLIPGNPALGIERFPDAHTERDYLRLDEIERYLKACSTVYRPVAATLIGSGARISEVLALQISDLELDEHQAFLRIYRSRKGTGDGSTKSDRFRGVQIGPKLAAMLGGHLAEQANRIAGSRDAYLFVMPERVRKRDRGRWASAAVDEPMDRNTVSRNWHKEALEDAGLRDMPLHALRHTAAAAWLAAGNPLVYVQRQLGHTSITTTERYYGHLERGIMATGASATEDAIARATKSLARAA